MNAITIKTIYELLEDAANRADEEYVAIRKDCEKKYNNEWLDTGKMTLEDAKRFTEAQRKRNKLKEAYADLCEHQW